MNSNTRLLIRRIVECIFVLSLFLGAGVLLFGCKTTKTGSGKGSTPTYDIERPPVEAPASVKASDFRLSPPEVRDISIKKLGQGKALVMVEFAPDKRLGRTVTVMAEEGNIVLHDDGQEGDTKADDGIFSAIISLDVDALVNEEERTIKALAGKKGPLVVHKFRGRDIVGEETLDLRKLEDDLHRDIIIFPHRLPGPWLVQSASSLFITDSNVVNDTNRTFDPCTGLGTPMGKWTFGSLMSNMANPTLTGIDPSDFVLDWLTNWLANQTVNGFTVQARTGMQSFIDQWPKLSNGKLDLGQAPMKLLAIVNRIDLAANSAYGPAGGAEGRFVFAPEFFFTNLPSTNVECSFGSNFNVIVEYGVPISSCSQIRSWANQWLGLQDFQLGSPQYNSALEAITDQFTAANANPQKPNGSALDQLRTDEIHFGNDWELREFHLAGYLQEATVAQTPDRGTYDGAINPPGPNALLLGAWVNLNAGAVSANSYTVPAEMPAPPASSPTPFLGGEVTNEFDFWNATNIATELARHNLSLNTCNACHGAETGTGFVQISAFQGTTLSGFLTGINNVTVPVNAPPEPFSNGSYVNPVYSYNDLERRAQVLWDDAHSSCLFRIRIPVILMSD
jgi:hypothetical protein